MAKYKTNSLSTYRALLTQWHPTKNEELNPESFSHGSDKKVWWKCPKGDDHEWCAAIKDRTSKKSNCPFCSGKRASSRNNLNVTHPDIAAQWHPTKNGSLELQHFTYGSNKKVWWKCPKGDDHEWCQSIGSRVVNNSSCGFCEGLLATKNNNLLVTHPDISAQWHPSKNGELKPQNFTIRNAKKVWWKCPNGDDHEWEAPIGNRKRHGCKFCVGQAVSKDNNLAVKFPDIAAQWHPTKNGTLKPEDLVSGSGKRVWWKCPRGDDHEWKASPAARIGIGGTGCPKCSNQTSAPEIRIYAELLYLFSDTLNRTKVNDVSCDIFIPSLGIVIEFDGYYYHRYHNKRDIEKNRLLNESNVILIRIRERPLKPITENDLIIKKDRITKNDLNSLVKKIKVLSNNCSREKLRSYISEDGFQNDPMYRKYLSYLPSPFPENSLFKRFPKIAGEFDYIKNYPLIPENFAPASHKMVWWKCPKGDDHRWDARISTRTNGAGCPYCAGQKASITNNLAVEFPEISAQWHPSKNGRKKPGDVTYGSKKEVWWKCPKGDDHEWQATINNRTNKHTRSNCPICSGYKTTKSNNLAARFPNISAQWHSTKNQDLNPESFSRGSDKKVWWKCPKGDDHEWQALIKDRTRENGATSCPVCSNRKVGKENNLLSMYPHVAKDWHPTLNGVHTPEKFTFGSKKKIWWICPQVEDHIWIAPIYRRTRGNNGKGTGCPFCSGTRPRP
jgi:hypothetical protein